MPLSGCGQREIAAVVLLCACGGLPICATVQAATVYEDVPLTASDFNGSGLPIDTVSGNAFGSNNGGAGVLPANQGTGPALGGPSNASSLFENGEGYFGTPTGVTPPSTGYDLNIYAEATSTTQSTVIVATNSNNTNSVEIGITGGNFVACLTTTGVNLSGSIIGEAPATTSATRLEVTNFGGAFTFLDDGVPVGTLFSGATTGWTTEHLGVSPGGSSSFDGYLADLTVSSAPEPAAAGAILCGIGLVLTRRRSRRCAG